jgi:predicted Kef-type K+ transport protein
MPILSHALNGGPPESGESSSLLTHLPGWAQALITLGAVALVVVAGRLVLPFIFRYLAKTKLREIFTASALLLVIGIALLMGMVGLSAALGAFVAGVVLADSEYRHQLEADIEPFKGLLLGLFFITVGAGIDFQHCPFVGEQELGIATVDGDARGAAARSNGAGWPRRPTGPGPHGLSAAAQVCYGAVRARVVGQTDWPFLHGPGRAAV